MGSNKNALTPPRSLTAHSEKINGLEAVGIDSVTHFLKTRDFSVVQTKVDRYDLDGRKVLTAQEWFERTNGVRAQLGRPILARLANMPNVGSSK